MLSPAGFFDLSSCKDAGLFQGAEVVWEGLVRLKGYMDAQDYPAAAGGPADGLPLATPLILHQDRWLPATGAVIDYGAVSKGKLTVRLEGELLDGASVVMAGALLIGGRIRIGRGVLVETGAFIRGPAMIGDCTEIRHGAYLRGYCLVGRRCVVGHATEMKHSVFLDDARAGHFAYLGDSIMGNDTNLGAGTKLANLRFTGGAVPLRTQGGVRSTGLKKMGAILGDGAQTGCNSVTNPGTLLGKKSILLPNVTAPSGYHAPRTVLR